VTGDGRGVLENVGGAFQILWALLTPFLRGWRERWGARTAELERSWPGDDLVPEPRWQYLHGITVNAPASGVWPWVVQIGQGRGGFYSFERLENLVGCRLRNADHILTEHQELSRVEGIRLAEKTPPLRLALVEWGRALVLQGGDIRGESASGNDKVIVSWGFFVEQVDEERCRLLARYRVDHGPGVLLALFYGPWLVGPIAFVMQRKMLRGIKQRAEHPR
jgi:hypothetical protein